MFQFEDRWGTCHSSAVSGSPSSWQMHLFLSDFTLGRAGRVITVGGIGTAAEGVALRLARR